MSTPQALRRGRLLLGGHWLLFIPKRQMDLNEES